VISALRFPFFAALACPLRPRVSLLVPLPDSSRFNPTPIGVPARRFRIVYRPGVFHLFALSPGSFLFTIVPGDSAPLGQASLIFFRRSSNRSSPAFPSLSLLSRLSFQALSLPRLPNSSSFFHSIPKFDHVSRFLSVPCGKDPRFFCVHTHVPDAAVVPS